MKLLKQHIPFVILLFFLILFNAVAIMMTPILLNRWIANDSNIGINHIIIIAVFLLCSYFIQILMVYLREHFALNFNISQGLQLINKVFGLSYDNINNQGPTYFLERISISINSLYTYISDGFVKMCANIMIVFAVIILVLTFNPILSLILFVLLPFNYFGYKMLNKELQKRSKIMQESTSNGWKDIINLCQQTDYIKQLSTRDELYLTMRNHFSKIYSSMAKVNSFAQSISVTLRSFNELAKNLMILLLAYGIIIKGDNPLSIVLLSIILPIYFNAINGIVGANLASRELKNSYEFIKYLENNQEEDGEEIISSIDQIEFNIKNLSVGEHIIKSNINSIFKKGDIISVNGDSGTGKSTLMKLLPKFRTSDTVFINGIDIRKIENKSLRSRLIYMSQDVPIVTGTLKENLFLGRTVNEEEIILLKDFPLLSSILTNKSFDTVIEENGANLSGGEKQKIALSRVIFSDCDVLVLDEITSNIDKETADEIYQTITSMNSNKIIFIISHDKMHLKYCNKSIELDKDTVTYMN